jgi:hypothetical protein
MSIVGVGVEPPQYALLGGECRCPRHANFPVRVNTVVGSAHRLPYSLPKMCLKVPLLKVYWHNRQVIICRCEFGYLGSTSSN